MEEQKKDLGLYIHIPFCVKKCDYCDFLSAPADEDTKRLYVQALIAEIKSYKELASEYLVKTIFIGGGTPSSIESQFIVDIMKEIKEVFTIYGINENQIVKKSVLGKIFDGKQNQQLVNSTDIEIDEVKENRKDNSINTANDKTTNITNGLAEITIEVNPGTLSKEKLNSYKEAGINRLSIGLQSTDNEELRLLGRIHTYEEFEENYRIARELGFDNINIDLISALPGQNLEKWLTTLEKVIALKPEHISAYSLIIEEGTPFFNQYSEDDQDEDLDRDIYAKTKEHLEQAGYYRYEISNYAKPGFESKHNSSYWTRVDYLGIGLGASSLLHNMRFDNEDNLKDYMNLSADYNNIRRNRERLIISQQMEEFMFLGLRMSVGVNKEVFKLQFGKSIETIYGEVIIQSVRDELLIVEGNQIFLSDKGIDLSNMVMSRFLLDTFVRS